jgi:HEXXH motif-containing protein
MGVDAGTPCDPAVSPGQPAPAPASSPLGVHALSERDFDALAAGLGDAAVVRRLARSERSHRRVLLRALLDEAARHPELTGPLAGVGEAWDLLTRAEAADARAAEAVVDYPLVGVWAALLLRRLRGARHEDTPLWVEAGGLHLLAAAAAVRAGLSFALAVPLRRGTLVLPSLGQAWLPSRDPWEVAEISVTAGAARVTGPAGELRTRTEHLRVAAPRPGDARTALAWSGGPACWVPLPRADAEAGGLRLSLAIDGVDPYRQVANLAQPAPPGPAELALWRGLLTDAWSLLVRDHPEQARCISAMFQVLVPTARAPRFLPSSASSGDAFGCMLVSAPDDATQLAGVLVHELRHAELGAILHLVDLYETGCADRFYAPWRDDPRPLGGLLQGVFAFHGVAGYWRRRRWLASGAAAGLAHFEFALWRSAVAGALAELRARPELTALGHRFLTGLATTLDGWLTEPVPTGIVRLARAALADHRTGWRLHHLSPATSAVAALAAAWAAGAAPPPPGSLAGPELAASLEVAGLETRALLARHALTEPGVVRGWRSGAGPGEYVRGAVRADVDWVTGYPAAAAAGYARALDDGNPADPHAWSGLALAAYDLAAHDPRWAGAARALAEVPELVRALHGALAAPAPDRLAVARWLGDATPSQRA